MSVSAFAAEKITKKQYDEFPAVKESANNNIVSVADGIDFVASNKDGWYLDVTKDLSGSISVAYKIGNEYFLVAFDIDGAGKYVVGDGSGKNGVNHAKIGAFEVADDTEPVVVNLGFLGWYLDPAGIPRQTSFYWQRLEKEGDMIDWEAVDAAYAGWVDKGGLEPDRTLWKSSGFAPLFFDDYADMGYGDFSFTQLEGYYRSYYVDSGYVLPKSEPATASLKATSAFAAQTILLKADSVGALKDTWNNIFDAEDLFPGVVYEKGSTPNVWHLVYTGNLKDVDKNNPITNMQVTFTNGRVFNWVPDMGFSTNPGGKNPGWVIVAPYDWAIAYDISGKLDKGSFLITTENGNKNFNVSGFSKGEAPADDDGDDDDNNGPGFNGWMAIHFDSTSVNASTTTLTLGGEEGEATFTGHGFGYIKVENLYVGKSITLNVYAGSVSNNGKDTPLGTKDEDGVYDVYATVTLLQNEDTGAYYFVLELFGFEATGTVHIDIRSDKSDNPPTFDPYAGQKVPPGQYAYQTTGSGSLFVLPSVVTVKNGKGGWNMDDFVK